MEATAPSPNSGSPVLRQQSVAVAGSHDHNDEVLVEDSQYQEISSTRLIPTKTGDAHRVAETQLDANRPGSADSSHSLQLPSEDAVILETCTTTERNDRNHVEQDNVGTGEAFLFARQPSHEPTPKNTFSFAKAGRQQMDFKGTHTRPAMNVAPAVASCSAPGDIVPSSTDGNTEGNTAHGADDTQHTSHQTYNSHDQEICMPPTEPNDMSVRPPEKRRKKKKKLRHPQMTAMMPVAYKDSTGTLETPDKDSQHYLQTESKMQTASPDTTVAHPVQLHIPGAKTEMEMQPDMSDMVQAQASFPMDEESVSTATHEEAVHEPLHPNLEQALPLPFQNEVTRAPIPESLSPVANWRESAGMPSHSENIDRAVTSDGTNIGTTQEPSPRVSKRSSKAQRKAVAMTGSGCAATSQVSSEINDWMQILAYKIKENQVSSIAEFEKERNGLLSQLQEAVEAKQVLEGERENAMRQKSNAEAILKKHQSQIEKVKKFMDGLGNDFEDLRKRKSFNRELIQELKQLAPEVRQEREVLLVEQRIHQERIGQTKTELAACRQTQKELEIALSNNEYLERRLSEAVGSLSEERDRYAQLHKKLEEFQAPKDKMLNSINSGNVAMLDELFLISASLEQLHSSAKSSDTLQEIFGTVQALQSQGSATMEDFSTVKGLIETLSKQIQVANEQHGEARATEQQPRVTKALEDLKVEFGQREELLQRNAAHCETINKLQEEVKACNDRISDGKVQIARAQTTEAQWKDENTVLQANIQTLQGKLLSMEDILPQIEQAKTDLREKASSLEAAKADLTSKTEELRSLTATNVELEDQIQTLQTRLNEIQDSVPDLGPEREKLEREKREEVAMVRREAEKFETELKAKCGNEVKKVTSERNRLQKQVNSLTDELSSCRAQIQRIENSSSASLPNSGSRSQELKRLEKLVQAQQHEIEGKQSIAKELNALQKKYAALEQKHADLLADLNAHDAELKRFKEEKGGLLKQVKDSQYIVNETRIREDNARAELEKHRDASQKQQKALENKLGEAKETVEHLTADLELHKASSKEARNKANSEYERREKALQERLSETQAELKKKDEEFKKHEAESELTSQRQWQAFEEEINESKRKVTQLETVRDGALAEIEALRLQVQQATSRVDRAVNEQPNAKAQYASEEAQKVNGQRQSLSGAPITSTRLQVPNVAKSITPSDRTKSVEPQKPRKKVDRISSTVAEVTPVLTPEELRPRSGQSRSQQTLHAARGPVVEESQHMNDPAQNSAYFTAPTVGSARPTLGSESSTMGNADRSVSQQLPDTVAESQSQNEPPSFAQFHAGLRSSQFSEPKRVSSDAYKPTPRDSDSSANKQYRLNTGRAGSNIFSQPMSCGSVNGSHTSQEFKIYEDSQEMLDDPVRVSNSQAWGGLRSNTSWSQDETDKYTYQKSFPAPNSASKIAHSDKTSSKGAAHRTSQSKFDNTPKKRTPQARGDPRKTTSLEQPNTPGARSRQSNSSDFVSGGGATRRRNTTYVTKSTGGKRRQSREPSGSAVDPPLAGRNSIVGSKRKANDVVIDGEEQARVKRTMTRTSAGQKVGTRAATRSQAKPSIHDLPDLSSESMRKSSTRTDNASQSRMRTISGASSRARKGSRMSSTSNEMYARFSQESSQNAH